ncbi:MAG: diaminopimelate epimerase [Caulobacterales bacterium]
MNARNSTMRLFQMNGCGNRFAMLDARPGRLALSASQVSLAAGAAQGGVNHAGADQVIALEPSRDASADIFMRIWNADGSEVDACGNATRCAAWLIMEERGKETATIETGAGLLSAWRAGPMRVSVDMGRPGLDWTQIPLAEELDTRRMELEIGPRGAPILHTPGAVSMGNPHCVFFVDDVNAINIPAVGPMVENHPLFPERVNVGFAQILSRNEVRLRVWERGAGLTLACGTGACAALVAGVRRGLLDRKAVLHLDGGDLDIEWRADDDHVIMTGPIELERESAIAFAAV